MRTKKSQYFRRMKSLLFSGLILLSLQLCQSSATKSGDTAVSVIKNYHINEPDIRYELPAFLCEISGLSLTDNPQKLFAISDERGQIIAIDKGTGQVDTLPQFMSEGDFEGIERIGDIVYALKSNGKIFAIKDAGKPTQTYTIIRTPLSKPDDCEGLGYDAAKNQLIISAKGGKTTRQRYVFGWNLTTSKLDTLFSVKDADFADFLRAQYPDAEATFDDFFGKYDEEFRFQPSSVVVEATTGDYYLLSSAGKWLAVVDAKSLKIKDIMRLNKKVHSQPEGMVLDADGTLWISNECKINSESGIKSPSTLLGFKPR